MSAFTLSLKVVESRQSFWDLGVTFGRSVGRTLGLRLRHGNHKEDPSAQCETHGLDKHVAEHLPHTASRGVCLALVRLVGLAQGAVVLRGDVLSTIGTLSLVLLLDAGHQIGELGECHAHSQVDETANDYRQEPRLRVFYMRANRHTDNAPNEGGAGAEHVAEKRLDWGHARVEQEGKVANFGGNLMRDNCDAGRESGRRAPVKRGGDSEAVGHIVHRVTRKVDPPDGFDGAPRREGAPPLVAFALLRNLLRLLIQFRLAEWLGVRACAVRGHLVMVMRGLLRREEGADESVNNVEKGYRAHDQSHACADHMLFQRLFVIVPRVRSMVVAAVRVQSQERGHRVEERVPDHRPHGECEQRLQHQGLQPHESHNHTAPRSDN
eukprot:Hpha_TRINITY_DN16034_c0_g1::TRINITY_DN16034_c0_g1_i1::g.121093::m.121093